MNFILFTIVPAVAVLFYLMGGLMILVGGARPGLISTGKNFFWNTTWGLVIIFGAWMITNTVLKSLVGDQDISNNWFRIECTTTVQQPPAITKYACNSLNICVVNQEEGTYINDPTCGNKCMAAPKKYSCNEQKQCIEDPAGKYDTPNCDNECQPPSSPVSISTSSLPDAIANQSYAQPVNTSGGISPYSYSINAGSLPPGLTLSSNGTITGTPTTVNTYTFTVKVEDSTTPTKQSATKELSIKVVAATAGVVISNVAVSNVTATGATITWTTDKPSTSQVEYGTTSSFGSSTSKDNTLKTSHSVALTGLTANVTYYFRVKSSVTGFNAVSSTNNFKTAPTTAAVTCLFSGVNLCGGQSPPGGCANSNCSQYAASVSKYANGAATANMLKSILFNESSCNISAANPAGNSYGLMQMQPSTANMYRTRCGVQENITSSWLTSPANAEKSICIAAQYVNAIAQSRCGSSPRNIYAGYNGGTGANGACGQSASCAGDKNCADQLVMRWECLYDDTQHTTCNTGYNETRTGVMKVVYCVNNPGF